MCSFEIALPARPTQVVFDPGDVILKSIKLTKAGLSDDLILQTINSQPGEYTLEWFESPEYPPFKRRPQDIAVPHPEFRVSDK